LLGTKHREQHEKVPPVGERTRKGICFLLLTSAIWQYPGRRQFGSLGMALACNRVYGQDANLSSTDAPMRFLLHSFHHFSLACWILIAGCSGHAKQSVAPAPSSVPTSAGTSASTSAPVLGRPTLTELTPTAGYVGNSGILILKGTNFVPGTTIRTPQGLDLRNVRVNGPMQITAG
jgi:hypothetical protein